MLDSPVVLRTTQSVAWDVTGVAELPAGGTGLRFGDRVVSETYTHYIDISFISTEKFILVI